MDKVADQKQEELKTFLLLTVVLAPVLSVMVVGGYGLMIWISQILMGPPGTGL
ncbi:MAG: periplasmic nitrate reductase, NapE protein [Oceanospirillaceae bacterium]|nr:periplasmic nitrate reductase, NapE protein [Oceanospirillaceae bacterium]MCP5349457.1 periplasmic nitrate reductase, NapE protein [Oceanospirillaceae bacterium]